MRLLFDQNLSHRLVTLLAVEYPGSMHVRDVGLSAADDRTIWEYAAQDGFVLVSKDSDFEQRALLYGHPPKVVWLRLGNSPTAAVVALLLARRGDLLVFEMDPTESILILA